MSGFPVPDVWLAHRVSYGETDTMGVVYYAEYLHFFERARSEFFRSRGMPYSTVEERGIILPVREARCRYRSPARYDELIRIRAGIGEWGRASLTFVYEIRDEGRNRLLTDGTTQHACITRDGKPVPVPDWLREALR